MNKKAFTFLELLVVVLIIGILAGIALPQYQKVKVKAESRQLIISLKALAEAQERFYLTNGEYANTLNQLDLDFSGYPNHSCPNYSSNFTFLDCYSNDESILAITDNYSYALFNKGKYIKSGFTIRKNRIVCYTNYLSTDELCKKIFNCTTSSGASDLNKIYYCSDI